MGIDLDFHKNRPRRLAADHLRRRKICTCDRDFIPIDKTASAANAVDKK